MPDDYQPPADVVELAAALGVDLARATAECRDYFAGKGQPMADWSATLRNWVRRSPTFARPTTTRASLPLQSLAPVADDWDNLPWKIHERALAARDALEKDAANGS